MTSPVTVSGGDVRTPVGSAPVIPILLGGFGIYLLWFGVKYWRGTGPAVWPSYPIKGVLQGKGLPHPEPAPPATTQVGVYEAQIQQEVASSGLPSPGGGPGGAAIAADAEKYVGKVPYKWGRATPQGWDCSGMCNWVIGHDLSSPIPNTKPPFSGQIHGPDVASWISWGGAVDVAVPQIGDLACWGPNAHMGIMADSLHCISAQDPAVGTTITPVVLTHTGIPVYRRVKSAGGPAPTGRPQNIARMLLARFGWGASEFPPLVSLWNRESGWNPDAVNPSSGALGIAQALGHGGAGTGGTLGNEYGAQYGLTVDDARAANSGSALPQIRWGLGYIKQRYGSPAAAWQHEQQFGWYAPALASQP